MKPSRERAGIAGLLCLFALLFAGCLKNNSNDNIVQPSALVSVINTSPTAGSVDFVIEPNHVNTAPIDYGNGLDYFPCYLGKRTVDFYVAGTSNLIKTDTITLRNNNYYSLYLIGSTTKDILRLLDTVKQPASGMAGIRLVNVSPDAPAVDLVVKGGATLATNKSYKGYSGFMPVQGNQSYTLEVHQAGTSTVLATLTNVNIRAASIYTVWLQGLAAATDDTKLKAGLQQNVYWY